MPGARWVIASLGLLVAGLVHPATWFMSGVAQVVFQASIGRRCSGRRGSGLRRSVSSVCSGSCSRQIFSVPRLGCCRCTTRNASCRRSSARWRCG